MEPVRIRSQDWECSICQNLMDGRQESGGEVCISRRCMHVFHRVCINQAIEQKRECPQCRSLVGRCDFIDNPNFPEQYCLWEQDQENYQIQDHLQLRPERLRNAGWYRPMTEIELGEIDLEARERNYPFSDRLKIFFASLNVLDNFLKESRQRTEESRQRIEESRQRTEESRQRTEESRQRTEESRLRNGVIINRRNQRNSPKVIAIQISALVLGMLVLLYAGDAFVMIQNKYTQPKKN